MENKRLPKINEGLAKGGKCYKCGLAQNYRKVKYCSGLDTRNPVEEWCVLQITGEHLHRTCDHCGYIWGEQTADA